MKGHRSAPKRGPAQYGIYAPALKPGDILMTACHKPMSRAIRGACKSRYSHAAIHETNGRFFEAITRIGVTVFNIARYRIRDPENIRVLRVKDDLPDGARYACRAAEQAGLYLQRGYWYQGALRSRFGKLKPSEQEQLFCSYLVAQAYADAGLPLAPDRPPQGCHPWYIEHSPCLADVTDRCLCTLRDDGVQQQLIIDDGAHFKTPAYIYHRAHAKMLKRITAAFRRHRLSPPATVEQAVQRVADLDDPTLRQTLDREIVKTMDKGGFVDLYARVMVGIEFEPVAYPDDAIVGELRATLAHYQGMLANVTNDLRTEAEERDAARQLHALTGLTGFLRLQQHYARRAEGMLRYQVALVGEIKRLEILLDRSPN